MPIYHVVLFKLKDSISTESTELNEFKQTAHGLVGKIPGLLKMSVGAPHVSTAHRSQGFNMGLVAILDKPATIKVYAEHPEHLKTLKAVETLCTDRLAYDMEFDD